MTKSDLTVIVGADLDQLKRDLKNGVGELDSFHSHMKKVGGAIAAAFTVDVLVGFGKEIIETTAKFQKFEAVLTNTLGSNSEAKKALHEITDFAAQTPFQVDELTSSFVKLVNQGFKPTFSQMTSLGDLAASQGKSFDQLTEAIIDAQTGEFERLKEFGIRASKEGDKVSFTFKGVKTQADFTAQSIRDYILSLGSANGVSGSMAAISKTLGGQISNLEDSVDQLKLALGESAEQGGLVSDSIQGISTAVQTLTRLVKDPGLNDFATQWLKLITTVPRWTFSLLFEPSDVAKQQKFIDDFYQQQLKMSEEASNVKASKDWNPFGSLFSQIDSGKVAEVENIKNLTAQLNQLQKDQTIQTGQSLAVVNQEIEVLKEKIEVLRQLGLAQSMDKTNVDLMNVAKPDTSQLTSGLNLEPSFDFGFAQAAIAADNARIQHEIAVDGMIAKQNELDASFQNSLQIAQSAGASIGEAFGVLASEHQSEADKIKAITNLIVDEFYKQAVAAVVANSAALGPFGVAAAVAGLTFIKSIFAGLGASGGGGSSSGGGSATRSADTSRSTRGGLSSEGNEIKVSVQGIIEGDNIRWILNRNTQLNGRTR